MRGQTVILYGQSQRKFAHQLIDAAPTNAVVNIREEKRTIDQNDKMWAMLSDISRQVELPRGGLGKPETWKLLVMRACGHEIAFELGLDGHPFPIGLRSSRLTVKEMSALIEFIYAFGAERNVEWTEPERKEVAA